MAAPAIAVVVAKRLIIDIFTDPQKIIKYVLIILGVLLAMLLIFALPLILIVSVPGLLVKGITGGAGAAADAEMIRQQMNLIAIYQSAPITVNQRALDWIEQKKKDYTSADDIVVRFNFNLDWQALVAIDAVRYNQNFDDVKQSDIIKLAETFLVKKDYTEKYTVKEEYQVEEKYQEEEKYTVYEDYKDPKTGTVIQKPVVKTRKVTKSRIVTKTRTVVKTRAIIEIGFKEFSDMLTELDFDEDEKVIAINMYEVITSADEEGNLNLYDDIDIKDLKEYPPGSSAIPYFNQTDKRWANYSYGSTGTIMSGGCGPTSLAMVACGITGRSDINPKSTADWSVANGHRAEGAGSYWSLMTAGGKYYGLKVNSVSRKDPNRIAEALSQGHPLIASMGPGHFTSGGHFIVLRGITSKGKILVYDPASVNRSNKEWDLSTIMNESSTNEGENGCPFWVFSSK